jgi:hypothetical protein
MNLIVGIASKCVQMTGLSSLPVVIMIMFIINVYLPCDCTADRLSLYRIVLENVWHCTEKFIDYNCIVAVDLNVDFSNMKGDTGFVVDFIADRKLSIDMIFIVVVIL